MTGECAKFKICLVGKDFTKWEETNLSEVLSPLVSHMLIYVLLIIVTLLELELIYVKIMLLHDELEEKIYIHQLKDFVVVD